MEQIDYRVEEYADKLGHPDFPSLTELKEKNLDPEFSEALDELQAAYGIHSKNRRQRRGNHTGHSKHSRFIWLGERDKDGEPVLTKFHFTKVRPWVRKETNRKRTRIANASKVKNRGK